MSDSMWDQFNAAGSFEGQWDPVPQINNGPEWSVIPQFNDTVGVTTGTEGLIDDYSQNAEMPFQQPMGTKFDTDAIMQSLGTGANYVSEFFGNRNDFGSTGVGVVGDGLSKSLKEMVDEASGGTSGQTPPPDDAKTGSGIDLGKIFDSIPKNALAMIFAGVGAIGQNAARKDANKLQEGLLDLRQQDIALQKDLSAQKQANRDQDRESSENLKMQLVKLDQRKRQQLAGYRPTVKSPRQV